MTRHCTIGIDPGLDGGIACIANEQLVTVDAMPTVTYKVAGKQRRRVDAEGVKHILEYCHETYAPVGQTPVVVIEQQSTRAGLSATAVFSTGYGYGLLTGLVTGLDWSLSVYKPKEWQKEVGITKANKALSVDIACRLWPDFATGFRGPRGGLKDGPAEAALIAAAYEGLA